MAVASPVLEREANREEIDYTKDYRDNFISAEEVHNSRISANYARLINPESRVRDIVKESVQHVEEVSGLQTPAREVETESLYLVENARADADIFRADSAINRRTVDTAVAPVFAAPRAEEDDDEDLRPTQTTIQYKTVGAQKTSEEGKIDVKPRTKKLALTKKDKIVVAVALAVIVALFVLIIVNSAIISNLSSDVSALQANFNTVENAYEQTLAAKNAYLEQSNLFQVVSEFASENVMVSIK